MHPPQLYVFAGPNGAGKSTLAALMIPPGTSYFDGDHLFTALKKQFYDLNEGQIMRSINDVHFPEWKEKMINLKNDAAFETNFRDPDVINSVQQFMNNGYESRLLFMGLDSVEASIERVRLRVAKGGHAVPVEYININFIESLNNLYKFYEKFTSVHLYQNLQKLDDSYEMTALMTIKNKQIQEELEHLPDWAIKLRQTIAI